MPLIVTIPPQSVPMFGGFDYVAVDAQRRRVYAAHTRSEALLVVDADTGKVLGQVRVGPMHGVAVDPETGHVFTGNGTDNSVSEVDPVALKVVRSVDVDGHVDAVAYDATSARIYADEDDGTRVFVIDAKSMKTVGSVALPGHKPEFLSIDPKTHLVYQNIADRSEFVVIDPVAMTVTKTVATPEITNNHPLQFDAGYGQVLVGGKNGILAAYDTTGKLLGTSAIQLGVDQCSLDQTTHLIACAGSSEITISRANPGGPPTLLARGPGPADAGTVGIDPATGNAWVVWSQADGDFIEALKPAP